MKDGGTYGCEGPGGHEPLACPRKWESRARGGGDAHPAAWSLHSIDIWVLNSVGADLSRAGIGRGPTHRCRARQSLGPPLGSLQVQQSKGLPGAGWVRGSCLRLPGCAALGVREQSRGRCSAGLGARRGLLRIFQSCLLQAGLSPPRAREKPCTAIARSSTNSRARREGSCSLWDTLDPQPSHAGPWVCSPSLEGQGSSEGPAPLHGAGMVSSDPAAVFNLRSSQHVRSRAVGAGCSQASCGVFPFALSGSAGGQTAASSPECFAGGGTHGQQRQRPKAGPPWGSGAAL